MKTFDIRYSDGTQTMLKATNEDMARQFAMERKYGKPHENKTWPCDHWTGRGLSVKEIADDAT